MRFFLDSNVLVSGTAFSGTEQWILLATFRREHTFVISEDVRREALGVLQRKFSRLREEAEETLFLLRVEVVPARDVAERLREFPGLRDPNDAHVLAAALAARCDAIITGDRDLLALGGVEGIRILRPSQARRLIAASP